MKIKFKGLAIYLLLGISAVIFLGTSFYGLSVLSTKSKQLVNLKLQNKTADDQLTSLALVKKQVQKYSYFNQVAKTVIPNDKDQAQAVIDIFQMANAAGIALQNIDFPASTLGVGAGTSVSPTGATSGSSPLTQAKTVTGIPGLYSLQLVITPQVGAQVPSAQAATYPKFLDFLNRIEHDRRTAQITQVSILPQSSSDQISFNLTLNIFIKP